MLSGCGSTGGGLARTDGALRSVASPFPKGFEESVNHEAHDRAVTCCTDVALGGPSALYLIHNGSLSSRCEDDDEKDPTDGDACQLHFSLCEKSNLSFSLFSVENN